MVVRALVGEGNIVTVGRAGFADSMHQLGALLLLRELCTTLYGWLCGLARRSTAGRNCGRAERDIMIAIRYRHAGWEHCGSSSDLLAGGMMIYRLQSGPTKGAPVTEPKVGSMGIIHHARLIDGGGLTFCTGNTIQYPHDLP